MSTGIYSIGITGMNAAQLGLVTTEHNISNASTPGYNRQSTVQASNTPIMTGSGAVGQGTHVATIQRMYDQFLGNQVNRSQSNVSELEAYYSEISQIDNMLADANSGLSPAMQDFFNALQKVSSSPASAPQRQAMVSSATSLVARYQGLESRLSEIADGVNGQITSMVGQINSYAQQIANYNERIVIAQSSVQQPANDLLDQRDQIVSELNKLIRVTTTTNGDGSYSVFVGSGQQLVVGTQVTTMTARASAADNQRIVVGLQTIGGQNQELPENLVVGGELGGLVRFRTESLDPAFNQLGKVATTMALTFNAQHALGQDQLGNIAGDAGFVGDFFTISQPRVVGNANNGAGSPTISATLTSPPPSNGTNFYTDLTGSDYSLTYDGANLTLTRIADNKAWTGASVAAINAQLAADPQGFSLSAGAGAFSVNDSYLIQPTREAARNIGVDSRIVADPRLVAAAAPVRTTGGVTNTGSMTLGQGAVQQGYSVAGLPLTITATAAQLTGFPGAVTATYSDGSTVASVGNVNLLNGTATLKNVNFNGGLSFDISGTPAATDTFVIQRNTSSNGVSDGRNALLLGKLQSQTTVSGGTASYQAAYAQMVGDVGNKTQETLVTGEAQQALLDQATASQQGLSGVNLDEEAANLIKYQQAYQASAKMLAIGTELFDTLLSLGG